MRNFVGYFRIWVVYTVQTWIQRPRNSYYSFFCVSAIRKPLASLRAAATQTIRELVLLKSLYLSSLYCINERFRNIILSHNLASSLFHSAIKICAYARTLNNAKPDFLPTSDRSTLLFKYNKEHIQISLSTTKWSNSCFFIKSSADGFYNDYTLLLCM